MTAPTPLRRTPQPAVGVVCFRGDEVLLIRRGAPPRQGEWSMPGGKVEWHERVEDAALRELLEETGVTARLAGLVAVVDGLFAEERHYILIDYAAEWISGEPVAGDDAAAAAFHPMADIDTLGLWEETVRVIKLAREMVR